MGGADSTFRCGRAEPIRLFDDIPPPNCPPFACTCCTELRIAALPRALGMALSVGEVADSSHPGERYRLSGAFVRPLSGRAFQTGIACAQ